MRDRLKRNTGSGWSNHLKRRTKEGVFYGFGVCFFLFMVKGNIIAIIAIALIVGIICYFTGLDDGETYKPQGRDQYREEQAKQLKSSQSKMNQ